MFAYAANNPVKYTDPDGNIIISVDVWYANDFMQMFDATWPNSSETITSSGCSLIAAFRDVNIAINKFGYDLESPKPIGLSDLLSDSRITCSTGMIFSGLKDFLAAYGVDATIIDT